MKLPLKLPLKVSVTALLALAPMPAAAHVDHAPGGPSSFGDYLHYVLLFDHYAGSIALLVGGAVFIAYRNLRRKVTKTDGSENE
ncbi:MAG: hypothetical protein ACKVGZ_12455 [Alphaproteobacteria bacterium]